MANSEQIWLDLNRRLIPQSQCYCQWKEPTTALYWNMDDYYLDL